MRECITGEGGGLSRIYELVRCFSMFLLVGHALAGQEDPRNWRDPRECPRVREIGRDYLERAVDR